MNTRTKGEMPKEFWDWFNSKEKQLNLNDNQVAKAAGIAHSVISKARNGVQPIGHEALAKIAKALKTHTATAYMLAGYTEHDSAISPEHSEWMYLFEQLGEEDQEELLAIARVKAKRRKHEKQRG